jgi:hypothetical protein
MMRILLEECLPRRLKQVFKGYHVRTVPEAGWAGMQNGKLLAQISGRFDFFITIDRNLVAQNPKVKLDFGIIVIAATSNRFEDLVDLFGSIESLVHEANIGRVVQLKQD